MRTCVIELVVIIFPGYLDIGADVLDSTGQSVVSFGQLQEEDTWFELSPKQKNHFIAAQRLNSMLREKTGGIQQLLWKSGYERIFGDMPERFLFYVLRTI